MGSKIQELGTFPVKEETMEKTESSVRIRWEPARLQSDRHDIRLKVMSDWSYNQIVRQSDSRTDTISD